jgi:hypothetical protein
MATTTRTIEEIIPFANGSEFDHWQERNCNRCKKYDFDNETYTSTCQIAEAIADMAATIAPLSRDMAIRMGYMDKTGKVVGRDCTELVIGEPEPKVPPPPLPVDQELRKLGMAVLPGFEGV